jgi:hypothetical protein
MYGHTKCHTDDGHHGANHIQPSIRAPLLIHKPTPNTTAITRLATCSSIRHCGLTAGDASLVGVTVGAAVGGLNTGGGVPVNVAQVAPRKFG